MNSDTLRLKMVLPSDQYERITEDNENGYVIDVHELHRYETKRMINNIINLVQNPCRITVIHGYNRGTLLSKLVRSDLNNPKIANISTRSYNPGETFLDIA